MGPRLPPVEVFARDHAWRAGLMNELTGGQKGSVVNVNVNRGCAR